MESNQLTVGSSAQDQITAALQAGRALSLSPLLPMTLRGEVENGKIVKPFDPEVIEANVTLVALQAMAWNMPFTFVASEAYVIAGKLAYQGKLIAAVANSSGVLSRRLYPEYEGEGDDRRVTIYGTIRGETSPRSVTAAYRIDGFQEYTDKRTGKRERRKLQGWYGDVDQKLWYTGVVKWVRRHAPELLGGVTTDIDVEAQAERTIDGYVSAAESRASTSVRNDVRPEADPDEPLDPAPTGMIALISEYREGVDQATSRSGLEIVVDEIKSESGLTDPAKRDLVSRAKERWGQLPETEEASETE